MQVKDSNAREWYEKEVLEQTWSVRTLQRNVASQYYYRIQNDLIDTYGDEIEGISLVNGNIDSQIKKLEKLKDAKAEAYLLYYEALLTTP